MVLFHFSSSIKERHRYTPRPKRPTRSVTGVGIARNLYELEKQDTGAYSKGRRHCMLRFKCTSGLRWRKMGYLECCFRGHEVIQHKQKVNEHRERSLHVEATLLSFLSARLLRAESTSGWTSGFRAEFPDSAHYNYTCFMAWLIVCSALSWLKSISILHPLG